MKRFLFSVLVFISVMGTMTWLYDIVNLWLTRSSSANNAFKMERLFEVNVRDDVAIIGSSHAVGGYVPSVFGEKVFNYGLNGSCINETMFHLRVLLESKKAKTIVVNLDPWGFAYYGLPGRLGFAGNYRLAAIKKNVRSCLPENMIGSFDWIPGIRFQGLLRANLTSYLNARKSVTQIVDNGAMLLKNSRSEAEWQYIESTLKVVNFDKPSSDCNAELEQICKLIMLSGCKVVWVVAPCSPVFRKLYPGRERMKQFLEELVSTKVPGMDVVNLFDAEGFDRRMFVDADHLNNDGAVKFSRMLRARLEVMHAL